MEIRSEKKGNTVIYHLGGEMDMYTSSEARDQIREGLDNGFKQMILNCPDLSYIDSSGVGVLISLFTSLRKKNGSLYLCALQKTVYSVISFTKLTGFLFITDTLEEALDALGEDGSSSDVSDNKPAHSYRGILQDNSHCLLETDKMFHKEFNLDLRKVRRLSQLIVQKAPAEILEINLLEQQISELIKNAVRHGNRNDPNKKVKIWFSFSSKHAHLVVRDEGSGFKNVALWNDFYLKKMKAFEEKDFDTMMDYLSYRTADSNENDGGNALFAAVEFWNQGVVISEKGNTFAVKRVYS